MKTKQTNRLVKVATTLVNALEVVAVTLVTALVNGTTAVVQALLNITNFIHTATSVWLLRGSVIVFLLFVFLLGLPTIKFLSSMLLIRIAIGMGVL